MASPTSVSATQTHRPARPGLLRAWIKSVLAVMIVGATIYATIWQDEIRGIEFLWGLATMIVTWYFKSDSHEQEIERRESSQGAQPQQESRALVTTTTNQ